MRLAASTDRVPPSLLPGCEESSEEENERGEYESGNQRVVDPGHFRQSKVDIGWGSGFHVESHGPRHEYDESQTRQAESDYQQEGEQEGLEH